MDSDTLAQMIGNVGVPAGIAFFVLYRLDGSLRELTAATLRMYELLAKAVGGKARSEEEE
jgi:hypothetical protein